MKRFIDFAVLTANIINDMPNDKFSIHLAIQLVRSGTSPALDYGETQAAELKKDFIHKMSVVLIELRESHNCLRLSNDPVPASQKYLSPKLFLNVMSWYPFFTEAYKPREIVCFD